MKTSTSTRRPQAGTVRLLALALVAATGSGYLFYQTPVGAVAPTSVHALPAMPVSVAAVIAHTMTEGVEFSGRLEAIDEVEVRAKVAGRIASVNFEPDSLVGQGATLFVIDPRPFAAMVAHADAAVASARVRLERTTSELGHAQRLFDDRAIGQHEFDRRRNAQREAHAALQAAQAALDSARLELGYTRITAPVSGRVSRAEVAVGNLVAAGAGGTRLAAIVSTSPIYATFEVNERSFLRHAPNPHLPNPGARPGDPAVGSMPVFLGLSDESGHPHRGEVTFVDNRIDPRSGTILLRAVFDNPDGRLTPGMPARLKVGGAGETQPLLVADRPVATGR